MSHFMNKKASCQAMAFLMKAQQLEHETLWVFLRRFNAINLEVLDLDLSLAITAFTHGSKGSPLDFSLMKRKTKTMSKLLECTLGSEGVHARVVTIIRYSHL